jgi:ferric iron reductase protein FhuF
VTGQHLKPAAPGEVAAALAAAAGLGLFFRLADPRPFEAGWQPVGLLYAMNGSSALDAMLDDTVARLGGCERRVAASLLFQGYAARLLSPQIGCLVTKGCVPAVPTARLSWRRPDAEVVQLGIVAGAGWLGPADALIGLVLTQSFDEHLRPLAVALRARAGIPASLLRDNAASALVGALRLADDRIAAGWRFLAEQALDHPLLHGAGAIGSGEPAFVRRSCCLYYRVDNGGICGDCPLTGRAIS